MLDLKFNYVRNCEEILKCVKSHLDKFRSRAHETKHQGFIPKVNSQFSTLFDEDMSDELKSLIFADSDFPEDVKKYPSFIQIQMYNPGDYIVWHSDDYNITKLYLVTLTSSEYDGLCVVDSGKIIKQYDVAGTLINFDYDAPHAVEPVKNLRFSLVVGI